VGYQISNTVKAIQGPVGVRVDLHQSCLGIFRRVGVLKNYFWT
jgi:hypothetical protein